MGARGPRPQPERKGSRLRTRQKPLDGRLAIVGTGSAPEAPEGLLAPVQAWWDDFWASELAKVVLAHEVETIRWLAMLKDERDRAFAGAQKQRFVPGSTKQPRLNPLFEHVNKLDDRIQRLEDRFALNLRARLAAGIQLTENLKRMEDLLRRDEDSKGLRLVAEGDLTDAPGAVRRPRGGRS